MLDEGLTFDTSHTSLLTRAVVTQHLALEAMGQVWLPVDRHWRLNERHYGAQGLDKVATTEQHGQNRHISGDEVLIRLHLLLIQQALNTGK